MRMISKILSISCICLGFFSCNNDILTDSYMAKSSLPIETKAITNTKRFNFTYKDNHYTLEYKTIDDSLIWVGDTTTFNMLVNLKQLPSLTTYMHRTGEIEYFDDSETFLSKLQGIVRAEKYLNPLSTLRTNDMEALLRGTPPAETDGYRANLFLFDDDGYSGKMRRVHLKTGQSKVEVSNLKKDYSEIDDCKYEMNDKTTALCAYSSGEHILFQMYEDSDFKDHNFSFTVYPGTTTVVEGDFSFRIFESLTAGQLCIPNLKECMVDGLGDTWNDRISSVRISAI